MWIKAISQKRIEAQSGGLDSTILRPCDLKLIQIARSFPFFDIFFMSAHIFLWRKERTMEELIHKRIHLTSFQTIILGFAGVILLGALLLMLPISSSSRVVTPFHEALFTSTSAVCVTGLIVQDTGTYWSVFG